MEDTTIPTRPFPPLCGEDVRALDALAESGFRGGVVPEGLGDRARRLLGVLSLLDTDLSPAQLHSAADRSALVDVTMARVLRSREDVAARIVACDKPSPLAPPCARAVDEMFGSQSPDPSNRVAALLALLGSGAGLSQPHGRSLVDRTMASIHAANRPIRLPAPSAQDVESAPGWSFRLRDLVSVAAVVLIGISIMWPMLVASREQARMIRCADNTQRAGAGFAAFATDHDGRLPQTEAASFGTLPWWNVGDSKASNSSNLYRLADLGYVLHADLACPGNPDACECPSHESSRDWRSIDEVSYSYQIPMSLRPILENGGSIVLMADRSPVVLRAMRGESIDPDAVSPNHGGRGQHVLFGDGSVRLFLTPTLDSGDNLWLPRSVEGVASPTLTGTERPADASDAFVGP